MRTDAPSSHPNDGLGPQATGLSLLHEITVRDSSGMPRRLHIPMEVFAASDVALAVRAMIATPAPLPPKNP